VETVRVLLGRCLRAAGVDRVFGADIPGVPGVATPEPAVTALLADCDGRLGPGPGCGMSPDGTLRLSSRPGARVEAVTITEAGDLPSAVAVAAAPARAEAAAAALRLDLDLDAPAPPGSAPVVPAPNLAVPEPLASVDGPVFVLVGPGVVRAGQGVIDGLRAFAAAAGVGVANTWGAKGVFAWDSPHHMGTAGLQARDFELLGFADAAMVVASGIDPDESARDRFALAPVVPVSPARLSTDLGAQLGRARGDGIPPNQLYERLAAVAQPGYVDDKVPLHPARAVADLRAALPPGGVVAAEPGVAGLWVARTFPTTEPASVVVPATVAPGAAAGIALAAALRGRPAVAVVDAPLDDATATVVDLARTLGLDLVISVWDSAASLGAATDHAGALADAFTAPGVSEIRAPVAVADTNLLLEAAGPVVAWENPI
jgi:Thiamine pyrophosphate enzyme, central domain